MTEFVVISQFANIKINSFNMPRNIILALVYSKLYTAERSRDTSVGSQLVTFTSYKTCHTDIAYTCKYGRNFLTCCGRHNRSYGSMIGSKSVYICIPSNISRIVLYSTVSQQMQIAIVCTEFQSCHI